MKDREAKTMRDAFIEQIYQRMFDNEKIFFLTADFGSPVLDKLRERFKERVINVGIAEQNLINVSTGLAVEGFIVYAYAISSFLTMRAYEQNRVNLSIFAQTREININLIGVGAGLSYEMSGPTHHCLEDIALMRLLPNFVVFSPSDWVLAEKYVDLTITINKPKYLRFDAKMLSPIYENIRQQDLEKGFCELKKGKDVCLVSTGYMTRKALKAAEILSGDKISCGVLDVFLLKPLKEDLIFEALKGYKCIISIEEGFINQGGLDTAILGLLNKKRSRAIFKGLGFKDRYVFELGSRDYLHSLNGLDSEGMVKTAKECLK